MLRFSYQCHRLSWIYRLIFFYSALAESFLSIDFRFVTQYFVDSNGIINVFTYFTFNQSYRRGLFSAFLVFSARTVPYVAGGKKWKCRYVLHRNRAPLEMEALTLEWTLTLSLRMLYSQGYVQWRVLSSKWLRMVTSGKWKGLNWAKWFFTTQELCPSFWSVYVALSDQSNTKFPPPPAGLGASP